MSEPTFEEVAHAENLARMANKTADAMREYQARQNRLNPIFTHNACHALRSVADSMERSGNPEMLMKAATVRWIAQQMED